MFAPAILAISASTCAVQLRDSTHDVVWPVAVKIVSIEISVEHVGNLLTSSGIPYFAIGSAGCSFLVDPKNLERARKIITMDEKKNFWHYGLEPPTFVELQCDVDRLTLFEDNELGRDALLRATALEALIAAQKDVSKRGVGSPHIRSIKLWEMPYLGCDFQMHRGIKAEFDIRFRSNDQYRVALTLCCWNKGRRTEVIQKSIRAG